MKPDAPKVHPLNEGTGPVLVFAHGLEDHWRTWTAVAKELPQWRVLSIDLPWRAGNDYRWRFAGSPADWIAAALDSVDDPAPVLAGHSFGANALLELLSRQPERPCPAAVLTMPFYRRAEAAVTWRTLDRSRETFERQIRGGLRTRLGSRAAGLCGEVLERMHAKTAERIGPVGFLAVFEQYVASGHLPLAEATAPALVLGGEQDIGFSRRDLEALSGALPRGQLHCAPHFDHFCHLHSAAEVAAIVHGFARDRVATPEREKGSRT